MANAEVPQIVHGEVVVEDVVGFGDVENELHLLGGGERLDRRLHLLHVVLVRPHADAERSSFH